MAASLYPSPVKPVTAVPVVPQFPENPKSLILKKCKNPKDLNQIHAHLIKSQLILNPAITEHLLESSAILVPDSSMDYALSIFNNIDEPDSSSYNVMIRGLTYKQLPHEAIVLFKQMKEKSVEPNEWTFCNVFKACSRLRGLGEGQQIHGQVLKHGLQSDEFVVNTLIHMYASCGRVEVARRVFDGMPERDVVAWNSMFAGYAKNGKWKDIVGLFYKMRELDIEFDEVTMTIVLNACGRTTDLELGEWISNHIEAIGLKRNETLVTSLFDMYAKCGKLDSARRLFDEMKSKDVVAWSAMISGYNQANRSMEALDLFREMQKAGVDPNEVTMVSVLYSCGILGALETGKWIHSYIKKKKMKLTLTLGTALIDFYAKCGDIKGSLEVFTKLPIKNVFTWTAIIQGLASNGEGRKALEYFHLMLKNNVEPNDVTFLAVLSACSHAGLIDESRTLFLSMSKDFDIEPRIEHFGCMVDILGRAGLIDEALEFIKDMPIKPNAVIWRTLLASCRSHKHNNVSVGEESFQQITDLEPAHSGDYILLSNIYASGGRVDDAINVMCKLRETGIKKTPGCSLIEIDGEVYEFFCEDKMHSQSKEIYVAVEDMMKRIKAGGYEPNTADARLDAEEEEDKEASVSHHSEKLAVAFGLIRTTPGTTIRITKNLRVCLDCHNAMKVISKEFDREVVVRDRTRFHHFKDGACSCKDYW